MLKGILFIIAIIVTFDIGKAIINSYREEHALEKVQEQKQQLKTEGKRSTSNNEITLDSEDSSENDLNNTPMNLTLPDDDHKEEQGEIIDLESQSSFSNTSEKDKSTNIKAKPIMTFDVETRTPDVTGVTVEVKKKY